ncbi:MAG: beta-ketoacyl-ACP synthase II [Proteobacteria bacterium]|nr:beta-ketoacyl-ACP synthase II [Pseudomonadota bacterium]
MRRVVVTGLGVVSPCGLDTESTWRAVVAGQSGIGPITRFDASGFASRIAGECAGFAAERYFEKKRVREGDRFIHLAVAAAQMLMDSSGFEPTEQEKDRVGTFVGVGLCGLELIERMASVLAQRGPRKITPYFIPATIANLSAGQVSIRWGFRGPSFTTTSACSSGGHAIGEAFRWIQRGDIDAAIAGGAESTITGLGVGGFTAMRALSRRNDQPAEASRPFDRDRDGFVIAEGAGLVLLEERDSAMRRRATIHAELAGYGATADAYHITQPAPEGAGAQRAMRAALADARVNTAEVDHVNAHATSTPEGDLNELRAIRQVFGDHAASGGLLISGTKSMTGHLLGAAGGLETVLTALSVERGIAPPTINLDTPDQGCEGLDLVAHQPREATIRVALSNSFGFGGTNVSLVLRRHD